MTTKLKIIFRAEHKFGPTDTIRAAIRRYNGKNLTVDEMDGLTAEFNKLNHRPTPRVGDVYYIPVIAMPRVNIVDSTKIVLPEDTLDNIEATLEANPDQFRGDLLPLLFKHYPHHYDALARTWKTANFDVYLNRVIKGAGQVGWSKDSLDEVVNFKNRLTE